MAEVTNELLLELMKKMHERFDRVDSALSEVKSELNAVRVHLVALQADTNNIYGICGRLDNRVDRIERRLELNEFAEGQTSYRGV